MFRGLGNEVAVVNWRTFEWAFRSRVGGKAESLDQALETGLAWGEGSNGRLRDVKVAADVGQKSVQSK